ncbi:hypothetical protein H0H87_011982 [Tephrocybe sp. NHM501043]|nr:hypothetical protein H0H87_011982 [Tephrocybe sp. NHM501043]
MQTQTAAQTTVDQVDDILEMFYANEEGLLDYDEQEDLAFYELYGDQHLEEESSLFHLNSFPKGFKAPEDEWEEILDLLVSGDADTDRFEEGWDGQGNDNAEENSGIDVHGKLRRR